MEEIDISQLLGYFKSKVIYVIFAMSIAFCLSSIYVNKFRVPEYTSSTTILLNKKSDSESINATDLNINKSLIKTYGEIIKSKRVLREVINNLSLDKDYGQLSSNVRVSEVTDTSIIKVSVTDTNSELAASIANEIASVFTEEIVEIYNIENISIIDKAEVSKVASSTSTMKIIGLSTIAGALISIAVVFIVFYFDTTIKNEEDIERVTGLPVIGVVPISREKIKGSAHRKYYEEQAKKHKTQEILPVEREVRRIEVEDANTESEIAVKSVMNEMPQAVTSDYKDDSISEALDAAVTEIEERIKIKATKVKTKNYNGSNKKNYYKKNNNARK